MSKPGPSWEACLVLFAILVTATTGLAYQFMLVYSLTIPWFVWALLVIVSALVAFGPRLLRRQPRS